MAKPQAKQLVVCVDNDRYPASLGKRKIYVVLRDAGVAIAHFLVIPTPEINVELGVCERL
jgi:hypothetical protein